MRKAIHRISAFMIAGLLSLTSIPVSAASSEGLNLSPVIDDTKTGSVAISYTDDTDGRAPVEGAKFTLYKIGKLVQSASSSINAPDEKTESVSGNTSSGTQSVPESDASSWHVDSDRTDSLPDPDETNDAEVTEKATIASEYESLIDGVDINENIDPVRIQGKVQEAYKKKVAEGITYNMTTDKNGEASVSKMNLGLYLAVETNPAKEHFASIPFFISIPQMIYSDDGTKQGWSYDIKVYPKALPAGDLAIEKKLAGQNPDKNKDWHFKVTFDTKTAKSSSDKYTKNIIYGVTEDGYHTAYGENQPDEDYLEESIPVDTDDSSAESIPSYSSDTSDDYGRGYERASKTYNYTTSDGRKGTIRNGGTITLKGGQTATISCIPIGTTFSVSEAEANQNNYQTTVKNDNGAVTQKTVQRVTFVNTRVIPKISTTSGSGTGTSRMNNNSQSQPVRHRTGVRTGDIMWYIAMTALALSAAALTILAVRKSKNGKHKGGNRS